MEKQKIDRINFLAGEQKKRELTEAERLEQAELRREYIAYFRAAIRGELKEDKK